ncbi:MAG: oxygen-independent coproporphyrinogen III oxidase [Pseudomonadota bacterium]
MPSPSPFAPEALECRVPRYTSYPSAAHFRTALGAEGHRRWLAEVAPAEALSLYVHVPFCAGICAFCAFRTQSARHYAPVLRYVGALEREIGLVGAALGGAGRKITRVHWGGGSPTVLDPPEIARVHRALVRSFPGAEAAEFSIEVDPRDLTAARLAAFTAAGLTRATLSVQDMDATVQAAIGRWQGRRKIGAAMAALRKAGVDALSLDLLYGLPQQTSETLARTIEAVLEHNPERLAVYGYAHVPWMAKRQRTIVPEALPDTKARRAQAALVRAQLLEAGYHGIGIDHFARPGDPLVEAAAKGRLKRGFLGYSDDPAAITIGFGASAISTLPQGYVQNQEATALWRLSVEAGRLPVARAAALGLDDRIRRDAISEILCSFSLDLERLHARYGDFAKPLHAGVGRLLATAPAGALIPWRGGFRIAPEWPERTERTRLIAATFDRYLSAYPARYALAI